MNSLKHEIKLKFYPNTHQHQYLQGNSQNHYYPNKMRLRSDNDAQFISMETDGQWISSIFSFGIRFRRIWHWFYTSTWWYYNWQEQDNEQEQEEEQDNEEDQGGDDKQQEEVGDDEDDRNNLMKFVLQLEPMAKVMI